MRWYVTTKYGVVWYRAPSKRTALKFAIKQLQKSKRSYACLLVMTEEDYKQKNKERVIRVTKYDYEDIEFETKKANYLQKLSMTK